MQKKYRQPQNESLMDRIYKLIVVLLFIAIIFSIIFLILQSTGMWQKINSMEKLKTLVLKGGVYSFLIFMLIQFLQTTVLQIPGIFVTVFGALVFGRWQAFLMSYIATILGSLLMFWVGRKAGKKFLHWLVGQETAEKWIARMTDGKYVYFLMMLFPLFPDDILCVVAGLTNISFSFFFWTNIITRALGILVTVYFGSGAIIPYHGWGFAVWSVLIVAVIVLFFLSVRYKDKIDDFFSIYRRKKNKKK